MENYEENLQSRTRQTPGVRKINTRKIILIFLAVAVPIAVPASFGSL